MSLSHTHTLPLGSFFYLTLSISSYTYIVHAMTWYVAAIRLFVCLLFFRAQRNRSREKVPLAAIYELVLLLLFFIVSGFFAPVGERKKEIVAQCFKMTLHHLLPRTTQIKTTPECLYELVLHTDANRRCCCCLLF
jgi:ABC-type transport system involved in cytochrome c biogenesis permease subunit